MARTPVTFKKKDFFESFEKKYPDIDISSEEYGHIVDVAGLTLCDMLLKDGEFKLGSRLGPLIIRKFLPKGRGARFMMDDKRESRIQKKLVYQFNDHTGGFIYRILWSKRKCKAVMDKNMWVFRPIRSLKRKLAFVLKNHMAEYPKYDHYEQDRKQTLNGYV